ncbi:MAG: Lrp/AsnC family transcriptional regulator [Halieaceae bacterium]
MSTLDSTDRALLAQLRQNARLPVVELARQLGVSRATVQNRMRRLEQDGVILGYTVKLRPESEADPVRAHMYIEVNSHQEAALIRRLRGLPEVGAVHHTSGHWDLLVEVNTDSLVSLNRIVGEIRLLEGVHDTESNLLLASYE